VTRRSVWSSRIALGGAEHNNEERGRTNGGDKAKWATAPSVTLGAVVRGPSHVGRR
jgi:hypothetical protein